jgi:peptide/nickel transport system permease protein
MNISRLPLVDPNSPGGRTIIRFLRNRSALIGLIILILLVSACVAAPLLTSKDPIAVNPSQALQPPGPEFLMGSDNIGRDVFTRFLYGGRISLRVGLVAVTLGAVVGIFLGLISGYLGGWLDSFVSWFVDVLLAFPDILLALTVVAILGPGVTNTMIAVGVSFIPSFMRVTRSNVLHIREMEYITAAKALGSSNFGILTRHVLPNTLRTLLVLASLGVGNAILAGAALSFLGLGGQPPTPEWGAMLNTGQKFIRQAWWLTVFPGMGIFFTILSVNLIGDGISDAVSRTTTLVGGE